MKVVAIMPAHDEAAILEENATRVWGWGRDEYGPGFALVISENGSTDGTAPLARRIEKSSFGTIAICSEEAGKGGAIKRAAAAVEADIYLMLDADLSADLSSAQALVAAVASGADIAIGSRRQPDSRVRRPWPRRLTTVLYATAAQAALGLGVRDLQCGCKAFARRVRDAVLPRVSDDGWFFDTELLAKARQAGMSIEEIGIGWKERPSKERSSKLRIFPTGLSFLKKLCQLRRELR